MSDISCLTDEQFLRIRAALRQSGYKKANSAILWPYGKCIHMENGYTKNGYKVIRLNGKHEYVHRVVWRYANGEIPAGMCVLHKCDNPPCANLDHLFLGTRADNCTDRAKKERGRLHKIDKDGVRAIRGPASNIPNAVLASVYNVSSYTISSIKNKRRRIHIE